MSDAGEIIKSGAADKLADIIHKLAGPMADEIGLMMGDKIKVYRLKNWLKVVDKAQKLLAEAKLPVHAVPPRLFLPIVESASLESDDTLQDMWAGLLASASQESDALSPSFIETLKQLTPAEAKALNSYFDSDRAQAIAAFLRPINTWFAAHTGAAMDFHTDTFLRLGLIHAEYDLQQKKPAKKLGKSTALASPTQKGVTKDNVPTLTRQFTLSGYAVGFLEACQGPKVEIDDVEEIDDAGEIDDV